MTTGIVGLSITLFAVGGSGSDSAVDTPKEVFIKRISETSWMKDCFPVFNYLTFSGHNYITLQLQLQLQLQ